MADILAYSNTLIPTRQHSQQLHNTSAIPNNHTDDYSQSLQVMNPQITIHDLLESLDSYANTNQYHYKSKATHSHPGSNKQNDQPQSHQYREDKCKISIHDISTDDYRITRETHLRNDPDDDEDDAVLQMAMENLQLESTMEQLLSELHQQTITCQHLMHKMATNNTVLAQYQRMYYHYQHQINAIDAYNQHPLKLNKVEDTSNYHSNHNSTTHHNSWKMSKNNSSTSNITDSNSINKSKPCATINSNAYTIEYPKFNKCDKGRAQPQLSELEEQSNAINSTHNDSDDIDKLFRNSMPVSTHLHQANPIAKATMYKKIGPTPTWDQPPVPANRNFIQQNKANLRRRLSQRQPMQQQDHKKAKIQSKYSTPVKNEESTWAKVDNRSRKPIFNHTMKPTQQNSGRARVSAVKIDVRAFK